VRKLSRTQKIREGFFRDSRRAARYAPLRRRITEAASDRLLISTDTGDCLGATGSFAARCQRSFIVFAQ
jgi:hypothetical protein